MTTHLAPTRLTAEDRRQLDERGLVRLPGLLPKRACDEMAERLWAEMARKDGMRRDDPATWSIERPYHFKPLQESGAFRAMATPALRVMLDDLLGAGEWVEPPWWGQPLVCCPSQQAWNIPVKNWHFDPPADPRRFHDMFGRLFVLLAPLKPGGGGTLVASGSHELALRLAERPDAPRSSSELRKRLMAEHPWFNDLMSPPRPGEDRTARFMDAVADVDGVSCQILEITGEAGDVFLMHPAALHTLSPNVLDAPRLALAQTILPKRWFEG